MGGPANPVRILVVDDSAQNRAVLAATLEDEGHQLILCTSGPAAITAFESEKPDLILLDVNLPGTNGHEVCTRIRSLPAGTETPILFLTSQRDADAVDATLSAGGDDFLTKPVRPAELILRIRTALELKRTTAELRAHYDLVTRLQLQKEQLTGFVVHDLKNPVNSLDLHAQVLLRDTGLSEAARRSVLHIRNEARVLDRLISNLLDISRGEEGRLILQRSELDVSTLAAVAFDVFELSARAKNVTLVKRVEPISMLADPDAMRRILENLLENAIRHTPEGSSVELSVRATPAEVEIRVSDAGPGVPVELRERIFDRFFQVESEQEPTRGAQGLGLTFVKVAVEAHGGTVEALDSPTGAVFLIQLPRDSSASD
jgi:two-component system sensor histidine kinase/response regulator